MTSNDLRSEERYPLCEKVEYVHSESSEEVFQGLATNISKSGICLHVYKILGEGESIMIRSSLNNSCQTATLQWINEIDSGFYMAGFGCC